jgi:hypothetical protein
MIRLPCSRWPWRSPECAASGENDMMTQTGACGMQEGELEVPHPTASATRAETALSALPPVKPGASLTSSTGCWRLSSRVACVADPPLCVRAPPSQHGLWRRARPAASMATFAAEVKLFGKWSFEDVEVRRRPDKNSCRDNGDAQCPRRRRGRGRCRQRRGARERRDYQSCMLGLAWRAGKPVQAVQPRLGYSCNRSAWRLCGGVCRQTSPLASTLGGRGFAGFSWPRLAGARRRSRQPTWRVLRGRWSAPPGWRAGVRSGVAAGGRGGGAV